MLGVKDKRVLAAFAAGEPASGHKLSTDGVRLDGHWMGGSNIAEWAAEHVVVHDLGSRAAQTVQRALKRMVPARQWGGYNRGPGEYWIKKALAGHHKGALHRSLHVPMGEKIPLGLERRAARAPGKLGKRARLALTLRGLGRGKRRR